MAGLGFFGKNVEALARARLPREYVVDALMMAPDGVPDVVRDAWAEGLASWWERGEGAPGAELVFMSGIVRYTPEQQARLQAARARRQGGRPAGGEAVVLPALKEPKARQEKLELTRAWIVPEARTLDAGNPNEFRHHPSIRWLERRDGRVRVISEAAGAHFWERKMRLTEIDLATFREREVGAWTIKDARGFDSHLFPAHVLLGRWVFCVEKDVLRRRDPVTGEAREMALPVRVNGPIWAIDKHLYATWDDGGIVRVDPESGAWEILADSRRRPAQGELDDRFRYDVTRIWRGTDGVLRASDGSRDGVYVYDEARRAWRREKEKKNPNGIHRGDGYARSEYLERSRGAEQATSSHCRSELGRLLEDLDRSGKHRQSFADGALVYLLGTHRPPAEYKQDRSVVFHPFGGTVAGEDVWALFHCMPHEDWSPRLVWLPRRGKEIVAVELRMREDWMAYMSRRHRGLVYAGLGGEFARLSVGPDGLVFYAMGGAAWWWVSTAELAAVGVEVTQE